MHASGKIQGREQKEFIPGSLENLTIRKSILKTIGNAFSQESSMILHDDIGNEDWKNQLEINGGKPILENKDFSKGHIDYLFKETSIPVNIGETFNWSRYLSTYVEPFKKIRILDPYLYVNITDVKLSSLIRTLSRKSGNDFKVEIISNLTASNDQVKNVLEKVKNEISEISKSVDISLFSQKGSASKLFHKRVIWSDFWVLYTDRGLDFIETEKGGGTVKRENTLFISGKYASKKSVWHQIERNWSEYLSKTKPIKL